MEVRAIVKGRNLRIPEPELLIEDVHKAIMSNLPAQDIEIIVDIKWS